MLKQQETTGDQKYNQLPLWKRMTVVTAILFSGGSLVTLVPNQVTYAHSSRSDAFHHHKHDRNKTQRETVNLFITCKSGNGGKGGLAKRKSNGASGGAGGSCNINIPIDIFLEKQNKKD